MTVTLTVERPPHVDPRRWYDPRVSWRARQLASDEWRRANRPIDVTYETRAVTVEQPQHECSVCENTFKSWQGLARHHLTSHGAPLEQCQNGHDLTKPRARRNNGACRACNNDRRRPITGKPRVQAHERIATIAAELQAGETPPEVAAQLGIAVPSVARWLDRNNRPDLARVFWKAYRDWSTP